MEKWIQNNQGLIIFLSAQAMLFAAFQFRLFLRITKLEGDVKNSEESVISLKQELKEVRTEINGMKDVLTVVRGDVKAIEIHTKHTSDVMNDIKHTIDRTWEMRLKQ